MAQEELSSPGELEPGSAASSSGEESTSSGPLSEYFVRHKLTKLDTLAGLAVRYNVTVSDIKRANGLLADSAMFGKDALLIPTRPLPVGPEYSTWAGMIVTHYGRLGPSDDGTMSPSESPYAHFSRTRAMRQMRGYYSTGPSRSQSPQYGSGAGRRRLATGHAVLAWSWRAAAIPSTAVPANESKVLTTILLKAATLCSSLIVCFIATCRASLVAGAEDGDRHHLYASSRSGSDWVAAGGQPQVVELMERHSVSANAHYIEERLRRRGRQESQQEDPPGSSAGDGGGGGAALNGSSSSGGGFAMLPRQPLFSGASAAQASAQAQALASAGGRQLRHWKDTLLQKLKKVASQPALAVPAGSAAVGQQLGQAAVASAAPLLGGDSRADRQGLRQRSAPSDARKAD